MSKYQLENATKTDLRTYAYFCEGIMRIQREIGKGIIEYDFIDELIQVLSDKGMNHKAARLTNT